MKYQKAKYLIDFFPRLLTGSERESLRQYSLFKKLGEPKLNDADNQFNKRKKFFKEKFGYVENSDSLNAFYNGFESFVIQVGDRIIKDSPNSFTFNNCPKCTFLARTPYAKQCRQCGHSWHDEIRGEFQFLTCLRVNRIPYLLIVGELISGQLKTGYRIDFTNFQLNVIKEIRQIEFCLKTVNGVKKDLPSLGIEVNDDEERLIKKYLKESAKRILIIK